MPASLFDERYCQWVAEQVGAAELRPLGQDAELLQGWLGDHALLVEAQLLAWLFDEAAAALALAEVDLAALTADQVARPWVLRRLQSGPLPAVAIEMLRCAAALEQDTLAQLPPVVVEEAVVAAALAALHGVAPQLSQLDWRPLRALRLRGRVAAGEVWTGIVDAQLDVTAEHIAWQAAHEATVAEVASQLQLAERAVEQLAVLLLHARAAAAGLAPAHDRWLARLHPSVRAWCQQGPRPEQRVLLDQLRQVACG